MANQCPACGETALETLQGQFTFDPPPEVPGGPMVVPEAQWLECSSCGKRILPHDLVRQIELMRYDRLGLLRPSQIKATREKAGLTQEAMADWLGVGAKTYTRWESGRSYHNRSSDNLIRLFDQNPELLARIQAQRNPERTRMIRDYFSSLRNQQGAHTMGLAAHGGNLDAESALRLRELLKELANNE